MQGSEFWPAGLRLVIEAAVACLAISVVMTGAVFLFGAPYPPPAEAADAVAETMRDGSDALLPKEAAAAPAPEAPAADSAVATPIGPFRVRLGVFSLRENATALMRQLRSEGYWPELSVERAASGSELYHVYSGSHPTEAEARAEADRLRASGRDVYIEYDDRLEAAESAGAVRFDPPNQG